MRNINALRHRKRPARATDSQNRCSQLFPPFASTTNLAHHTKAHSTPLAHETGTPELSIDYSPYGEPLARSPEMERVDFNFDGKADLFDNLAFYAMYAAGDPRADLDGDDNSSTHGEAGDGDWDIYDILTFSDIFGAMSASDDMAVGVGRSERDDNFFGLAGYRYDPLAAGGAARLGGGYHQRHRWMSPVLGRWGQRDPTGFIDGQNLLGYVRGNPIGLVDRGGLEAEEPSPEGPEDPEAENFDHDGDGIVDRDDPDHPANDRSNGCGITEEWNYNTPPHNWLRFPNPGPRPRGQPPFEAWETELTNPWHERLIPGPGQRTFPLEIRSQLPGLENGVPPHYHPGGIPPILISLCAGYGRGTRIEDATCDQIRDCIRNCDNDFMRSR